MADFEFSIYLNKHYNVINNYDKPSDFNYTLDKSQTYTTYKRWRFSSTSSELPMPFSTGSFSLNTNGGKIYSSSLSYTDISSSSTEVCPVQITGIVGTVIAKGTGSVKIYTCIEYSKTGYCYTLDSNTPYIQIDVENGVVSGYSTNILLANISWDYLSIKSIQSVEIIQ